MFRFFSRSPLKSSPCRYVPAVSSFLILAIGLVVMIGWHARNTSLIQAFGLSPGMQYNAALCFCVLGTGFGLMLVGRRYASATCSVAVSALAGLTLYQYLVGADVGLDTLWMEPFVTVGTVHPGRMAPVTAICFLFAAGAIFLFSLRQVQAWGVCFLIAVGLFSVGVSVAFGFVANLPTTFWWGHASKMSLHAAVGFLVLGIGIAGYACQQAVQSKHRMFPWAIVALEMALLLMTLGLWQAMTVLREADLQRVLRQQVEAVQDAIRDDLQGRAGHLGRMAERWGVRGGTPRDEWEKDAANYVQDLQGFLSIQWLNRKSEIEWVMPRSLEKLLVGRDYMKGSVRRNAWQGAFARRRAYTSQLTPLLQGGEGFLTIVPVYRQNEPDGAIVAVYRLADWLNTIFSQKASFADYGVAVFHEGAPVYRWAQGDALSDAKWTKVRDIQFDGLQLRIQVWPSAHLQRSMSSALPEVILLVGVALSTLLTWSVSLLRSIRAHGLALSDANNRLTEQMGKLRKTEQSLQESTRLQQAILDGASYPIISTDVHGTVTSFNKAASQALGYSPEEVIGKFRSDIFHDAEEFARFRQSFETAEVAQEKGGTVTAGEDSPFAEPLQRELDFVRKNGSRFPAKVAISALRNEAGETAGYVGIAYDLTQAKLAEEAIHTARHAAEQANQAKSVFLANMSHEVRTPLNAIIGINQMLLDSKLQPEQRLWARTLQDSAESLLTVVNDILDFSKVEAGQVELETIEFDLSRTLDQLVRLHGPKASTKGLILQTRTGEGMPQRLIGDPTRLLQVLNNLVSNAIKFTERGTIDVTAGTYVQEGDDVRIRFEVVDQGIGMDEETCSRIFDPFAQADASTTRRFGGTGLGLSICRLLVERMGGEIHVESAPGNGSRFWFVASFRVAHRAPSLAPDAPAEKGGAAAPVEWSQISVLLADDSATNRLVAKHQLQKLGCRVEVAQNGREALELLAGCHFDVVLMDGQMPEMDGYEATIELRRREGDGRRTPVVALTANAMPGEREHCLAIGMDHYLSKPFKAHQLETVLREVLSRPSRAPASA